ncbi:LysM peptidoglycan-binding domain-containing protein [Streptococcus orisasini]|uniref:LysM peptidoglycan-binding domain-containing protein n=1 Tax=Streptococcus orisasini TaxID=1080071 RepID=UPI00070EDE16|nr:LysM domain-containing protein [Streptococcus orisasini]
MKKKHLFGNVMMLGALILPIAVQTRAAANDFYANQTNAQRADITNWVASTPEQISSNISSQHINVNHLNGERYVIQWGDTLWGISQATGISIQKLAYDNHITNIDLIYAGDVLILKRDGRVPSTYTYKGTGYYCAKTSVTINNFYQENNLAVIVNNTSFYEDNHIEHNYPTDNHKDSKSADETKTSATTETSSKDTKDSSSVAKKKAGNAQSSSSDKKDASKAGTHEKTLEDTVYQDTVQKEINKLLVKENLDDQIDFLSHDPEKADTTDEQEDLEPTNLYNEQQVLQVSNTELTEKGAKAVAKVIYEQLRDDQLLEKLLDAQAVQLEVSAETETKILFNVTLYDKAETSQDNSLKSDNKDDVDAPVDKVEDDTYSSTEAETTSSEVRSNDVESPDYSTESDSDY